jgi:hypothetical protein
MGWNERMRTRLREHAIRLVDCGGPWSSDAYSKMRHLISVLVDNVEVTDPRVRDYVEDLGSDAPTTEVRNQPKDSVLREQVDALLSRVQLHEQRITKLEYVAFPTSGPLVDIVTGKIASPPVPPLPSAAKNLHEAYSYLDDYLEAYRSGASGRAAPTVACSLAATSPHAEAIRRGFADGEKILADAERRVREELGL